MKRIFVNTSVLLRCYFAFVLPILEYIVLQCGGQLLNVTYSFFSIRCIRWAGFVTIRVSCRYVIDVEWLGLVSFTRLIRTLITVCSASFHLLLPEFDIPELQLQINNWSLMYQAGERPICEVFPGVSGSMWNDLPYTVLDTGTLDSSKGAANR